MISLRLLLEFDDMINEIDLHFVERHYYSFIKLIDGILWITTISYIVITFPMMIFFMIVQ